MGALLLDLMIWAVPIVPAPPATPRAPNFNADLASDELCRASIFCSLEPLSTP